MFNRTDLTPATQAALGNHDVIVFDGECVLCQGFFQFMLTRDRTNRFRFATAQSPLGQAMYRDLGLPFDDFETNLVVVGPRIFTELDAFAAAMGTLGWPWRAFSVVRALPGPLKLPLYRLIARNRYRLFGRNATCMVPTPDLRARFLDLPTASPA